MGTDPNRNFDFSWAGKNFKFIFWLFYYRYISYFCLELGQGEPCYETYAGTAPFSEPETKAMSDFLLANPSITFYVAVHSAGPVNY
jgi:hypothetical protein